MLTRNQLHAYQKKAIQFIKEKKKGALFLDMGLGKTVTSLTCANDFLDDLFINKILIIAPLRVANSTWKQEANKWEYLKDLKISICTGSTKNRIENFKKESDIYIINRENIPWLVSNCKSWIWDMVIVDESSSFKNPTSKRFRALKKVQKYVKSIVLLTGTPSPNSYMDLWSQMYLIDKGERLGRTISNYRQRFFDTDYMGYSYTLKKGSDNNILRLISDRCIYMAAQDYIELPKKINVSKHIDLPKKVQKKYKELEKEFLIELENGTNISAPSAAAIANKLLQICNGSIYDEDGNTHNLHDEKLEYLKEIIDNSDENFLVAYNFKSDLTRILETLPEAVTLSKSGKELDLWNKGKIKILLAHPASAGYGLNAQFGGNNIIWFGLNWSLELYQQFNARLYRQGQTKPVTIIHLIAKNCIDEKVLKAIDNKAKNQKELLNYLKV